MAGSYHMFSHLSQRLTGSALSDRCGRATTWCPPSARSWVPPTPWQQSPVPSAATTPASAAATSCTRATAPTTACGKQVRGALTAAGTQSPGFSDESPAWFAIRQSIRVVIVRVLGEIGGSSWRNCDRVRRTWSRLLECSQRFDR